MTGGAEPRDTDRRRSARPLAAPVRNPFRLELTVAPSEIDELEHASNVSVLGWLHRAAVAHSTAEGFDLARYRALGGVFVVRRHEIDYLASALLGEELVAFTWPVEIGRASAVRAHEVVRVSDGAVIARGRNTWAFVDVATGRPTRLPPEVRAAFDPARFV